jgi:methionine biosynthesis protein MetW
MNLEEWHSEYYKERGKTWENLKLSKDKVSCTKRAISYIGKGKKVLDIGSYNGYIAKLIEKQGNEVEGVDFTDKAISLCKKQGIKCTKANIEKRIPFKDNQFDAVFMGETIEHIFDTDAVIKEINRILKPEGTLVITTPNIAALNNRIKLFLGRNPGIDIGTFPLYGSNGHIRYFTLGSLTNLLERNGFEVTDATGDVIVLKFMKIINLAKHFPTLSWSLIVKAVKKKSI